MTATRNGAGPAPLNPLWRWVAGHPRTLLLIAVVGLLLPFCDKPFNLDDPLFVWTARQIQAHPADPYGFPVNWYGTVMPMAQVMQNPPLAGYYLAGAATVLGGSERSFHLTLLLPALAVILGTYRLAEKLSRQPLLAALLERAQSAWFCQGAHHICHALATKRPFGPILRPLLAAFRQIEPQMAIPLAAYTALSKLRKLP